MDKDSADSSRDAQTGLDTGEHDLTALSEAKQIVKCLIKFIQGKKLYARNNPLLASFSREITTAFDAFFRHEEEFVLSVDQYSIQWREQVIYENSKREESIAFLLYKDGVGEITFQNSLNFEEVEKFANIIIDEMLRSSPEDDVVTKFWKAEFDHISYRVLDEYLSGEYGEGAGAAASEDPSPLDSDDHSELLTMFRDKGRVVIEESNELESLEAYYDKLITRSGAALEGVERERYFEDLLETIFQINSEELKMCHDELLAEKRLDSLQQLMETMLEFVVLSNNPPVMRDTCNIIDRLVDYFIYERDAGHLKSTLMRIREARNASGLNTEAQQYFATLERKFSHPSTLVYLTESIHQWSDDAEAILDYVASLESAGVNTLMGLLQNAESARLRNAICDHLFAVLNDDVQTIIAKLGIETSEVALSAIYLAGAAALKTIPPSIKELVFYPSVKVREEMVKYLAFSEDENARHLLLQMVDDEDKKIRMKALGALEGQKYPEVREKLNLLAFDKELNQKSHDEQEAIFMILGSVGDRQTVRKLREIVDRRRSFFGRKRDNSICVIRALEKILLPESVQLLEEMAESSSPLVQTQAGRALQNLKQSMNDGLEADGK